MSRPRVSVRACVARSLLVELSLVLVAAGCNGQPAATGLDDPLPSAVEATGEPLEPLDPPPRQTLPAAAETDKPHASSAAGSQTDTDWGRIWDAVPAAFPVYPGATASAGAGSDGPASAAWTVPGTAAADIAEWLQARLELATYSTEALSGPFEDGSYVVDSVGDADCRIETSVAPAGDVTIVTVRYGAGCPSG